MYAEDVSALSYSLKAYFVFKEERSATNKKQHKYHNDCKWKLSLMLILHQKEKMLMCNKLRMQ